VVDASFRSRTWSARSRDLARSLRVRFHFVECRAPLEVCHARLARREEGPSDGRLDIFDNFAARFEPVDEFPARENVVVDTSRDQATLLAKVRELLGNWPPGLVA
jgi:predicted kinase